MELFSGSNPYDLDFAIRSNRFSHVADFHARNFGNEGLASVHALKTSDDKAYALFQRDPKASHPRIGNRQHPSLSLLQEIWNHATAASRHITVANHTKPTRARTRVSVARNKELVRAQLGSSVKVDGIRSLIRA